MLITTLMATAALAASTPQTTSELNGARPYNQVAQTSPGSNQPRVLNDQDTANFRSGLAKARARDVISTRDTLNRINDPVARKLVEWALVDTSASQLSASDLIRDHDSMTVWPREDTRRAAAEAAIDRAGFDASTVLSFFNASPPETVVGTIALASAMEQTGNQAGAQALIRDWWRSRSFEDASQNRIYTRWGRWLTTDDHDARMSMLLSGPHGPATRAMVDLASPEKATVANAAIAIRTSYSPDAIVAGLTSQQALDPDVVMERIKILRSANRNREAYELLRYLPPAPSHSEGQNTLWSERRNLFLDAVQERNWLAAYDAMNGHGFPGGERKVDAEFFAGWVALTKLNDPATAARHFEVLRTSSSTPITQGRAVYWLGRAAEAQGDQATAQQWYGQGAQHIQSFYGQLAAEKAGITTLTLPGDPAPTEADIAAFEGNEVVRAMRILGETGEASLLRVFALHLDDTLPNPTDLALLMDATRGYGEGFTAMLVGRVASQRGILMPERMYPIRIPPEVAGAAPLPFTLAITRQESSFDARARSGADARGMMQFLPSTAQGVARRMGLSYSVEQLWDADYNMTLGSYHLGELTSRFGGSMLMTAVGYNAGPARSGQWVERCGDPRTSPEAAIDFIECAPFTETRNYMMRVMENMSVYKARLNGGSAPLTLSQDIAAGSGSRPRPY